jgi:GTP cyclohydrolase I
MNGESPVPDLAETAVASFLRALHLEKEPETLGTPQRVAQMWSENLLSGYQQTAAAVLQNTIDDTSGTVVALESIPFHSVCPHHLVPFFGTVDLCYEPSDRIIGLGSLEKLVTTLSRRLTLQETLTGQLVDALMGELGAQGAACRVVGQHLCLMLRGREPRGTQVVTYGFRGTLENAYQLFPSRTHTPVSNECGAKE